MPQAKGISLVTSIIPFLTNRCQQIFTEMFYKIMYFPFLVNLYMNYRPGKHRIATIETKSLEPLNRYEPFVDRVLALIEIHRLRLLGTVMHNFSPAGFTAVFCLSESHLSVHTWPEHGKINFDIYLSNYERENDGTVDALFEAFCAYFGGHILHDQSIWR